jgi:hypothetical protein
MCTVFQTHTKRIHKAAAFLATPFWFNVYLLVTVGIQLSHAQSVDSKENWVQFPPRSAVKLTEQIQQLNNKSVEKKDLGSDQSGAGKEKTSSNLELQKVQTPKPEVAEKKLISQDITWAKDHKTRTTLSKFSDGSSESKEEVIEPMADEPTYKGDVQTIQMTYADGVKTLITRKAKTFDVQWAVDHSTKTTVYGFSDGSTNIEVKHFPKKYSSPEFKNGFEYITVTHADGTQAVVENEAVDRKVVWSKDHLTQTVIYYFEDGKSYEESTQLPSVQSSPRYKDEQEIFEVTYADGFKDERIEPAVDKKVSWASDHQTQLVTYMFQDGSTNVVSVLKSKEDVSKTFKVNLETITYLYPDGLKTTLTTKAISEKVNWEADHITKVTEYEFADGSINKVTAEVKPKVSNLTYNKNQQILTYAYGDGTYKSVVNNAIDQEADWSKDRSYKTITYKFEDGSVNIEALNTTSVLSKESAQESDSESEIQPLTMQKQLVQGVKRSQSVSQTESSSKLAMSADAASTTQPVAASDLPIKNQNQSVEISSNESRDKPSQPKPQSIKSDKSSDQGDISFKKILSNLMDRKSEDQASKDHKPLSASNEPVYLQGLEIITKQSSDGKKMTQTFKAIDKEESWSSDKQKKYTTYKFADGSVNRVVTDMSNQSKDAPSVISTSSEEELTRHSLGDD